MAEALPPKVTQQKDEPIRVEPKRKMLAVPLEFSLEIISSLKNDRTLDGIIASLKATDDPAERFKIFDEVEKRCIAKGQWHPPEFKPRVPKDNKTSKKLRRLGNLFLSKGNNQQTEEFLKSFESYNKSACFAEPESDDLAIAYGNRVTNFYKLKMYDTCIESIKLAQSMPFYPKHMLYLLEEREDMCKDEMGSFDYVIAYRTRNVTMKPCVRTPVNPKMPFVAKCLELRKDEKWGRHIITTKELKVGEVLAVEDPFCHALFKNHLYQRCENCLSENNYNLLACNGCTTVMFCSDKCAKEGTERFHKYECPIMDHMIDLFDSCPRLFMTVRLVLCSVASFQNVDHLTKFVVAHRKKDKTVFDINYSDKHHVKRNLYTPVHCMSEGEDSQMNIFQSYLEASLICKWLLEHTDYKNMFRTPDHIIILKELIQHHIRTVVSNAKIMKYVTIAKEYTPFAYGMYPFRSLLNHSCAPNIVCTLWGNQLVMHVTKPIKAGEQLFDCYEPHHALNTKSERRRMLRFDCKCEACEKDWPLSDDTPRNPLVPDFPSQEIQANQLNPNLKMEERFFLNLKLYSQYFTTYIKYYPCAQLIVADHALERHYHFTVRKEVLMKNKCSEQLPALFR